MCQSYVPFGAFLYALREVFSIHWSSRNEKWKLRIIDWHSYFSHYLSCLSFILVLSRFASVCRLCHTKCTSHLFLFQWAIVTYHYLVSVPFISGGASIFFPLYSWVWVFLLFLLVLCVCVLIISNVSVYIHSFAIYHLVAVGIPLKSHTIHMHIAMRTAFKTCCREWEELSILTENEERIKTQYSLHGTLQTSG